MSRHRKLLGWLVVLALAASLGACQGLPPMQLVVVISPTPAPNVIMITVTPTGESAAPTPSAPSAVPTLAQTCDHDGAERDNDRANPDLERFSD
jgi:hypothetical protein